MFWNKKPSPQYVKQEVQRMMHLLRRWLLERAADTTEEEIYRATTHVSAYYVFLLGKTRLGRDGVESAVLDIVKEIAPTFRKAIAR